MEKVRWGVLGAGGIADKRTMPGMLRSEMAELVAFCEVDPERREELKAKYGVTAYTSAEELLSDERIEAVYVATPLRFHRAQAEMVLAAGKHMLLEKPLALTSEEGKEIVALAQASGLKTGTGFMMRFHALHKRLKEMVANDEFGTVVSARGLFGCWSVQTNDKWRHSRAIAGGGAAMDMGIHCIDLLSYILGENFRKVTAVNKTLAHTFDVEDTSCILLQTASGIPVYVDSYTSIASDFSRLEIYGTRGMISADGTIWQAEEGTINAIPSPKLSEEEKEEFIRRATGIKLPEDGRYTMYTAEIDAMCRSIRENAPAAVSLDAGVINQRVVEAAYRSSEIEKTVSI